MTEKQSETVNKASQKDVYVAINEVMAKIGYVQKQESDQLRYSYASEAAFIKAIRPHMVDAGLIVYPVSMIEIPSEAFTAKSGSVINVSMINVTYRFRHVLSETHFDVNVMGKGMDVGDKDSNKAMTVAFKYALRQTLMIETGDDPDTIASEEFEKDTEAVSYTRPLSPEALKVGLNTRAEELKVGGVTRIEKTKRGLMVGVVNRIFAGPNADDDRHAFFIGIFDEPSSKKLKASQVLATLKWLNTEKDSGGEYVPDHMSVTEAIAFVDHLIETEQYDREAVDEKQTA